MSKNKDEKIEEKNLPAESEPKQEKLIVHDDSENSILLDTAKFNQLWRVACAFAKSDIVPDHFKRKPENCFIVLSLAVRLGADPFAMLQTTYTVHGKPGLEAKMVIALINRSGIFKGPLRFQMSGEGKNRACRAYAEHRETGEVVDLVFELKTAEAEGWIKKNGSKWPTLTDQMLRYRAASFFCNLYCPEVKFGMMTVEELQDIGPSIETQTIDADFEAVEDDIAQDIENATDPDDEVDLTAPDESEEDEIPGETGKKETAADKKTESKTGSSGRRQASF